MDLGLRKSNIKDLEGSNPGYTYTEGVDAAVLCDSYLTLKRLFIFPCYSISIFNYRLTVALPYEKLSTNSFIASNK
jgi:hypothetical protein